MSVELNGKYITTQKAADLSGFTKSYITRLIRNHEIRAEKVDDLGYLILEEDFMRWWNRRNGNA